MSRAGKKRFRTLKIVGSVIAVLVVVALLVPFLVDLSSFKPQIQEVVADKVNAHIDFTSARLHLLPTIGVKLEKVLVENTDPDFRGTKLFAVDSVMVHAKILPLFTGKLVGEVMIKSPEFTLARKGLKNNLTALPKPAQPGSQPAPAPAATPTPAAKPADPKAQAETMAMVKEKVLIEAVSIEGADITIRDVATPEAQAKEPVKIRDLNIHITNIGLDRDIAIAIDTKLDVNEAGASVKGPIRMNKVVRVTMGGNGLEKATFSGKLSYDDLAINFRDAFVKAAGIPLNVTFQGAFVPNDFSLQQLILNFHNLKVDAMAHVVDFKDPRLSATLKVANENLASLGDVLPKHRDMLINGQLHLDAGAEGTISKLDTFATRLALDTKLKGTDLAVKLATTGVMPFKGSLNVHSQKIDLSGLLQPFMKPAGSTPAPTATPAADTKTAANGGPAAGPQPAAPAKDFELTPEQKSLLMGTNAEIRVNLREVNYAPLTLTNIRLDVDQKNLISSLQQFNIDGFGGKIAARGKANLGDSPISFDGDFKMNEIHPEQVMLVVKPEHKDVLVGRMNLDLDVKGRGTTVPTLNKTLNGGGSFKFLDGQLNTPSIAAKMQEEFDRYVESLSVSGAGDAIISSAKKLLDSPLAKAAGKTPPDIDKLKDQYKNIAKVKLGEKTSTSRDLKDVSGKIEIKDGKIYIASARTDGAGTMDVKSFVDLEMKLGGGAVFTASDATKTKLRSQSQYADLLFDDKNNLVIGMNLGGTVMDPKVTLALDSMRQTFQKKAQALVEKEVKKAAEDYIKNLMGGGAAKDAAAAKANEARAKAQEEAKKRAQEEAKKHEGQAKEALKGLFGK